MKKTEKIAAGVAIFVAAIGVICILVCLIAFGVKAAENDIPQITLLHSEGDTAEVVGCTREQLISRWGKADAIISGYYGEMWYTSEGDEIKAYYDNDGCVVEVKYIHNMRATIIENNGTALLLEPCVGEAELKSADRITVGYSGLELSEDITAEFVKGTEVLVRYDGNIAETYPAQINAKYGIVLIEE